MSNANDIDLDAILAKRSETLGEGAGDAGDSFGFTFAGRRWTMRDPVLADDEWKDELAELETDIDVAEHYMGVEQYEEFIDAGGSSGRALLALSEYMKLVSAENEAGPTRRSLSSIRTRRRSKQR